MGRTRMVLLFNDENADQKEVCDYLKSQPRSKTALVTELVQAWLRAKEGGSPVYAGEPVENTGQSIEALKSQITEELLQDRSFIQKVTERISSQVLERGRSDDGDCPEEETGMGFDFDEDMLLSGSNLTGGEMERRKGTSLQRWCFRRKLDVLYYWSGLQLAVFNAYLYIRYIVKYHRRPRRRSREEAERVVKQVMEQYKEHNEQ